MATDSPKDNAEYLKNLNLEDVNALGSELENMSRNIAENFNNILKNNNGLAEKLNISKQSFSAISNIAESVASFSRKELIDRDNINKLNDKAKIIAGEKVKLDRQIAAVGKQLPTLKGKEAAAAKKLLTQLGKQYDVTEGTEQELQKIIGAQKTLDRKTAFFDKLSDIAKSIPGLGPAIAGPFNAASKAAREMGSKGGSSVQVMGAGFKAMSSEVFSMKAILGFVMDLLFGMDKRTTAIQKNLNMTADEAVKVENSMRAAAVASGDNMINTDGMLKSQLALSEASGVYNLRTNETLISMTQLTDRMGLSNQEAARFEKFSVVNGKNLKEMTRQTAATGVNIMKANGLNISGKKILQDVAKITGQLATNLGNNPIKIAKAVAAARLLGTTLEGVANIGKQLVNFEDSITKELEAELLIGKDLNLERARALALAGDQKGLAEELATQVGTLSEFQGMNVIQQQMLAAAMGMGVDEMANMLEQQEMQNGMKEEQGTIEEQTLESMNMQVTLMEELKGMMEKVKEKIQTMLDGPIGSVLNAFKSIVKSGWGLYTVIGLITTVGLVKMVSGIGNAVKMLRKMKIASRAAAVMDIVGSAFKSVGWVPLVGAALAGAAVGAGMAYLATADDLMSPPGYGSRVLTSPAGSFALNDGDTVLAGTNLGGGGGNDAAMEKIYDRIERLASRPNIMMIDDRVLGEAGSADISTYGGYPSIIG
tara:strand:+ start:6609 stop:8738 length:2130 start_codon:yes stop_codon:yes gene_type:complete